MRKFYSSLVILLIICVFLITTVGCSKDVPVATKTYDEVVSAIYSIINDVSSQFQVNESDKSANTYFLNSLGALSISGGIVNIDGKLNTEGNLDYCIAINTVDRGIVFFTVLPKSLDMEDEEQGLQFVYLKNGERIGLLPAKFAISNDYSWYETYLDDVYSYYDWGEYLAELSDLLDTFGMIVDNSRVIIEFSASQSEIDEANRLIDKYNDYVDDSNSQIDAYNSKLYEYPENLFYVEEYFIDTSWKFKLPTPLSVPVPILGGIDQLSSQMQKITLLDKSSCMVERVTDKNFVVTNFHVRW